MILFVDHPEADFTMALTIMGLRDFLGVDQVVDFPVKGSYRGRTDHYRLPPQQVWGVDGSISAVYKDGTTSPFAWMRPAGPREWSFDEVCARMGEFSLVVASVRPFALAALSRLLASVSLPRLVLVDGEDSSGVKMDAIGQFRPKVYFKRHLVKEEAYRRDATDVLSLPFAIANLREVSSFSGGSPRVDVCLLGGSNAPGGKGQYEDAVRRVTSNVAFGQSSYGGMLEAVSSSRIAVAPRGHGQDTLRCFEFLGVEGPLVAIQKHTLVMPDPLVADRHVAWFNSPGELEAIVRKYLSDEGLRVAVAREGFAFAKEKHTVKARAQYLVERSLA
jgi:hypothetical protein